MTHSLYPYHTPDIGPVPSASPGNSAPPLSSYDCRPRLTGPRPPSISGKLYTQFSRHFLQSHSVEDTHQHAKHGMEPPWVGGGYHPIVRIKECCLHLQPRIYLFFTSAPVVPPPNLLSLCRIPCLVIISATPPPPYPLPVATSGIPLRPPPHLSLSILIWPLCISSMFNIRGVELFTRSRR